MRRRTKIETGEYYHIFNRGVEKRQLFDQKKDYEKFLKSIVRFNTDRPSWEINLIVEAGLDFIPDEEERLVDVVAYCLNPNHFHLILRQLRENGITVFMKKVCTGYAMYYNRKNNRSGVLFQGRFKSVFIDSGDLLLYISAYVNCNSQIHGIEDAEKYPWCSFSEYKSYEDGICKKSIIIDQFKNDKEYANFCLEKVVGMKDKKEKENSLLEY